MPRVRKSLQKDDPCEPGEHELGTDSRNGGIIRCKHCGLSGQTITGPPRTPVKGDYRVVCDGVYGGEDACSIGPSEATPHRKSALEAFESHQQQALEEDGQPHMVRVIQF